ncbi:hypothetical protein KDA_50050 [Dictyobacter alpinus]|uniref:Uncharacterized protein n=1 Tax=Dictyobacter alpinus TaxID=2014873 RepID=A0A402BDM2_9CHLR|nr:hypothetical protein KDA_50050 [Dictyobacter alpinus]
MEQKGDTLQVRVASAIRQSEKGDGDATRDWYVDDILVKPLFIWLHSIFENGFIPLYVASEPSRSV